MDAVQEYTSACVPCSACGDTACPKFCSLALLRRSFASCLLNTIHSFSLLSKYRRFIFDSFPNIQVHIQNNPRDNPF